MFPKARRLAVWEVRLHPEAVARMQDWIVRAAERATVSNDVLKEA